MKLPAGIGQRVGVLGGTFDPVHVGHLKVAAAARDALALDSVLFIPAAIPPHKPERELSSFSDRVAMLGAAVQGRRGFFVSGIEGERPQQSYTIDTLRILRRQLGDGVELFFILGFDAFNELATWKEYAHLVDYATLVVIERPVTPPGDLAGVVGINFGGFARQAGETCWSRAGVRGRICPLDIAPVEVSSTLIRQRVGDGSPISGLVAPAVEEYILAHGLYR